jgi:hypothetical protein
LTNNKEEAKGLERMKEILKYYDIWNTFRLFMLAIAVLIVSKIVFLLGDSQDGFELNAVGTLIVLGAIMIAGPVRKQWDNKYKGKKNKK